MASEQLVGVIQIQDHRLHRQVRFLHLAQRLEAIGKEVSIRPEQPVRCFQAAVLFQHVVEDRRVIAPAAFANDACGHALNQDAYVLNAEGSHKVLEADFRAALKEWGEIPDLMLEALGRYPKPPTGYGGRAP